MNEGVGAPGERACIHATMTQAAHRQSRPACRKRTGCCPWRVVWMERDMKEVPGRQAGPARATLRSTSPLAGCAWPSAQLGLRTASLWRESHARPQGAAACAPRMQAGAGAPRPLG